jgi:hypothetical protein
MDSPQADVILRGQLDDALAGSREFDQTRRERTRWRCYQRLTGIRESPTTERREQAVRRLINSDRRGQQPSGGLFIFGSDYQPIRVTKESC